MIGGKVKTVDDTAAKAVKGVTKLCRSATASPSSLTISVNARKGRNALKVTWDDGAMATVSSETIYEVIR